MRLWPSSNCLTVRKSPRQWKTPAPTKHARAPQGARCSRCTIESQANAWLLLFMCSNNVPAASAAPQEAAIRMRASAILSVEDLRKTYGAGKDSHIIIDGLSFSLRRGECYGLLGP